MSQHPIPNGFLECLEELRGLLLPGVVPIMVDGVDVAHNSLDRYLGAGGPERPKIRDEPLPCARQMQNGEKCAFRRRVLFQMNLNFHDLTNFREKLLHGYLKTPFLLCVIFDSRVSKKFSFRNCTRTEKSTIRRRSPRRSAESRAEAPRQHGSCPLALGMHVCMLVLQHRIRDRDATADAQTEAALVSEGRRPTTAPR